jgi:hypothetical protein
VAIKGKTKRSQGRTARRVTAGPRAVTVERRAPWYKAPAFGATLGIVALLVTLVVAVNRVQYGWARDDVDRFTNSISPPMSKVAGIAAGGVDGQPGFASVAEFAGGKVKAADVVSRAQTWQQQLGTVREQVNAVSLGEVQLGTPDGTPPNQVGGRVRELSVVRESYLTGVGYYDEAALAWQQAGEAVAAAEPKPGAKKDDAATQAANAQRDRLIQSAQSLTQKGQQALDVAATMLANIRARFALPLDKPMPGESTNSFSGRFVAPGGDPTAPSNIAPSLPGDPAGGAPAGGAPSSGAPAGGAPSGGSPEGGAPAGNAPPGSSPGG